MRSRLPVMFLPQHARSNAGSKANSYSYLIMQTVSLIFVSEFLLFQNSAASGPGVAQSRPVIRRWFRDAKYQR